MTPPGLVWWAREPAVLDAVGATFDLRVVEAPKRSYNSYEITIKN